MKHTLLATVAALGLFAAGATFSAVNYAARPDAQLSQLSGGVSFAESENDHAGRKQQLADSDSDKKYDGAAGRGTQLAVADSDHGAGSDNATITHFA